MSGQSRWVYEDSELHTRLLAEGWEQTHLRRVIFGSGTVVMLVKVESE